MCWFNPQVLIIVRFLFILKFQIVIAKLKFLFGYICVFLGTYSQIEFVCDRLLTKPALINIDDSLFHNPIPLPA